MPVEDILPEIAVLLTAITGLLAAIFLPRRLQSLGMPIALLGLAVAFVLCLSQLGESRLTFSGLWAIDGVSILARLLILATSAFVILQCPDWFKTDHRHGEIYPLFLFSVLGVMGLCAAADLLQMMILILLVSVSGYTLAAYHRDWPLAVEAGMKFFLIGALANTVLVLGVALAYGSSGTTGLPELGSRLVSMTSSPTLLVGFGLILVGLTFKLGAVPAHAWMPDVAEGSPAPVSAYLTVIPKIGAAVMLARLVAAFPTEQDMIRPMIAILSATTMTIGNVGALWQSDVRRLIGWSSISQTGYALMAVCVVSIDGRALPALLYFLTGYSVANLAAFAVITHLRGLTAINNYSGLIRIRPWLAITLTVSFLSLVGIPPLVGFFGKFTLFISTLEGGYGWLAIVAIINTVISLFYYLRVIAPMSFGKPEAKPFTLGIYSAIAVAIGLLLIVVFGIGADWYVSILEAAHFTGVFQP